MTPQRSIRARMARVNRWRVRRRKAHQRLLAKMDAYMHLCVATVRVDSDPTAAIASMLDRRMERLAADFAAKLSHNQQPGPAEVHREIAKRPWDYV